MSFEGRKHYLIEALVMCYSTLNFVRAPCSPRLDSQMAEITEILIMMGVCAAEARQVIAKALTPHRH